jgi:hypothetical protein
MEKGFSSRREDAAVIKGDAPGALRPQTAARRASKGRSWMVDDRNRFLVVEESLRTS